MKKENLQEKNINKLATPLLANKTNFIKSESLRTLNDLVGSQLKGINSSIKNRSVRKNKTQNLLNDPKYVKFMNLKGHRSKNEQSQIQIWNPSTVLSSLNTSRIGGGTGGETMSRQIIKRNFKFRLGKKLVKGLSLNRFNPSATTKSNNSSIYISAGLTSTSSLNAGTSRAKGKVSLINKTNLLPYLVNSEILKKGDNQNPYFSNSLYQTEKALPLFNNSSNRRKLNLIKSEGKFWASNWIRKIKIKSIGENYQMDESDRFLFSIIKERRFNLSKKFAGLGEGELFRRRRLPGLSFINDNLLNNQFIKYKFQHSASPYGTGGEISSNSLRVSEKVLNQIKEMNHNPEEIMKDYFKSYNLGTEPNQILNYKAKGVGVGTISASHIDFESFNKLLKSFFKTLSSIISLPIIESLPDKLNIRLFYYLKGNRKENRKLRKYKSFVKNSGRLFKDIMLRALISSKVGKESLALFLSNWKKLNNESADSDVSKAVGPMLVRNSKSDVTLTLTQEQSNDKFNMVSGSRSSLGVSGQKVTIIEPNLITPALNPSQSSPMLGDTALIAMERIIENLNSDSKFNLIQQNILGSNNDNLDFVQDRSYSLINDNIRLEKELIKPEQLTSTTTKEEFEKNTIQYSKNLEVLRKSEYIRDPALELLEGLSLEFIKVKIASPMPLILNKIFNNGADNDPLREEANLIRLITQDENTQVYKRRPVDLDLVKNTYTDICKLLVNLRTSNNPAHVPSNKIEEDLLRKEILGLKPSFGDLLGLGLNLDDTVKYNPHASDNSPVAIVKGFENIKFKNLSEFILRNYLVLYLYPLLLKFSLNKYKETKAQAPKANGKLKSEENSQNLLSEAAQSRKLEEVSNLGSTVTLTLKTKGIGIGAGEQTTLIKKPGTLNLNLFKLNSSNKDLNSLEVEISSLMKEKKKEILNLPMFNDLGLTPGYKKYLTYLVYSLYALYRSYLKTKIIRGYLSRLVKNYNKVNLVKANLAHLSNKKLKLISHNLTDAYSLDLNLNKNLLDESLKGEKAKLNIRRLPLHKAKEKAKYLSSLEIVGLDSNLFNTLTLLKDTPYEPIALETMKTISFIFDDETPIKDSPKKIRLRKDINYKEYLSKLDRLDQKLLKNYCQDLEAPLLNINNISNNGTTNNIEGQTVNNLIPVSAQSSIAYLGAGNDTLVKFNLEKIKIFIRYLEKLFNKSIQLDLTRIHYPYHESSILSQVLGQSSKSRFSKFYSMMKTLEFTASVTQPGVKLYSDRSKIKTLPSLLSGFKVKLAGRLLGDGMRPRFTVRQYQVGTLSRAKIGHKNTSRFTFKNKRGAYSLTVTMGHIFENIKS